MLAVIYLLLCLSTGYVFCSVFLPRLGELGRETCFKKETGLSRIFILLPAWYLTGTLLVTWTAYLLAYVFRNVEVPAFFSHIYQNSSSPLAIADTITLFLYLILTIGGILYLRSRERNTLLKGAFHLLTIPEMIFITLVIGLVYQLMWTTFFVAHDQLYVGLSVFSDFSPHLGMIRSFSYGNNFPTTYSHFAGEDIRYHFMFQFLAGNLEFLGMRLDYAFNVPSALSLISVYFLLYAVSIKLSGKRSVGFLACLFFTFRSSPSLFSYIADIPQGTSVLDTLRDNISFIGYTTNENWGLWNLNVYCNQRHLAFGLATLLLVLLFFLSQPYDMARRLKRMQLTANVKEQEEKQTTTYIAGKQLPAGNSAVKKNSQKKSVTVFIQECKSFLHNSLLHKDGWMPKYIVQSVILGIILGGIAFWNGAAVFAALMVLFMLAIAADRRLEYLITAVITTILSSLQSGFFIDGEVVSPQYYFGFISENRSLFGVMDYIWRLCGVILIILLAAFLVVKGIRKYTMVAFMAPFVFAFTISLTIDVTVNHKYIMMSLMLLGIFAAIFVVKLFSNRNFWARLLCVLIVIAMTSTGVYDFITVLKRNTPQNDLVFNLEDELTLWIRDNATSQDIFLTSNYALNQVVLGGAMLYEGWPYFPWSAGYDTYGRTEQVKEMYEASGSDELKALIKENNIRYIIVDHDNRTSEDYELKEDVISSTYEAVFSSGEGEWMTTIYDTDQPK